MQKSDRRVFSLESCVKSIKPCVRNTLMFGLAWITTVVHWWSYSPINLTRDCVTLENHWPIASLVSSIGRVFRSPLWRVEENGGPSASGRHLGWPHFRFPQMRSPKMATGSGRAAIFLHPPQQGSKNAPQVLDDVISGAAILDSRWRRWKWRLEDVETPVKTSYRRLPHPWVL